MNKIDKWLEARKNLLTASDCAAVLGLNPYSNALDVWANKTRGLTVTENDAMRFGKAIEEPLADLYHRQTGRPVSNPGDTYISVHPDYSWLGATLDRVISGSEEYPAPDWVSGEAPLELKSVGGSRTMSPEEWEIMPPAHYVCQLQIQMACTGADWGCLAGLFPGYRIAWKDIERDDNFLADAIPKLEKFWFENVQKNVPPDVELGEKQLETVKKIWNKPSGKTVELDDNALKLYTSMTDAKKIANEHYRVAKVAEANLRKLMEDAEFCTFPDGTMVQLEEVKRKGYTVEASSYTQLKKVKTDGK